ncbi:hypothetical protein XCR1_900031 [Xenorhabdus cabanillasii JM26]|uniref:Uncharacterized protein n=1 Tax=Xenorhabdus cabanillasii JM26 TaxID=1427517 RepID=W1JBS7_9GAMM|nr:hypothetical protein XCR1_900031 [Xenorhabdus cabanillasii JM26]
MVILLYSFIFQVALLSVMLQLENLLGILIICPDCGVKPYNEIPHYACHRCDAELYVDLVRGNSGGCNC